MNSIIIRFSRFLQVVSLLFLVTLSASAQNLTGRITCDGRGVKGVTVSDGDEVTQTDKGGYYALQSQKRNGYVFYSLPRGYEPELQDGFNPQFWAALKTPDVSASEVHDFQLNKVKNDRYDILIGADTHLANRANDLEQFREGFIPCLEKERFMSGGRRLYSMLLGDLTWDAYWTRRHFNLQDFMHTLRDMHYDALLWPVIGNHDNDPSVPSSDETDFLSSAPWRSIVCPNYYSFNLGRVHYVVLDDIYYKNEDTGRKYAEGVVGSRNYDGLITEEQFRWLEKDLALIKDKKTPIIVALHIPTTGLDADFQTKTDKLARGSSLRLFDALKEFPTVHVVSGHTHYNYTTHPREYPNVTEHNIAAVCAVWWNSGKVSGRHNCNDGSPGGYSLWQVNGKKLRWQYHSMEENGEAQMRVYDMNTVRDFYRTDNDIKTLLQNYPDRMDYGQTPDNVVMVNIFAYDDDWKVEIMENGQPLTAERVVAEDPFHTLAYDLPAIRKKDSPSNGSMSKRTMHMFQAKAHTSSEPVTVRVTDSFGQVYEHTIRRPHAYSLGMEDREEKMYK